MSQSVEFGTAATNSPQLEQILHLLTEHESRQRTHDFKLSELGQVISRLQAKFRSASFVKADDFKREADQVDERLAQLHAQLQQVQPQHELFREHVMQGQDLLVTRLAILESDVAQYRDRQAQDMRDIKSQVQTAISDLGHKMEARMAVMGDALESTRVLATGHDTAIGAQLKSLHADVQQHSGTLRALETFVTSAKGSSAQSTQAGVTPHVHPTSMQPPRPSDALNLKDVSSSAFVHLQDAVQKLDELQQQRQALANSMSPFPSVTTVPLTKVSASSKRSHEPARSPLRSITLQQHSSTPMSTGLGDMHSRVTSQSPSTSHMYNTPGTFPDLAMTTPQPEAASHDWQARHEVSFNRNIHPDPSSPLQWETIQKTPHNPRHHVAVPHLAASNIPGDQPSLSPLAVPYRTRSPGASVAASFELPSVQSEVQQQWKSLQTPLNLKAHSRQGPSGAAWVRHRTTPGAGSSSYHKPHMAACQEELAMISSFVSGLREKMSQGRSGTQRSLYR